MDITRLEFSDLLDGFEQRMKFVNIVKCITNYSRPDKIREIIPKETLDNLILCVLLFIMDHTLRYDAKCTKQDITDFLCHLSSFDFDFSEELSGELAQHIVVEVLQNGGKIHEFSVWNSRKMAFEQINIRLIIEQKGSYHLTDDACEFLFRTKEIDSELDFAVSRFKLKEQLKRNNYSDALSESRALISKIRNMKNSIDDFLFRCRENISNISVDQYEKILQQIRTLLENEDEEFQSIRKMASSKLELELNQVQRMGLESHVVSQNKAILDEIIQNISLLINEQRSLINRRTSMKDQYRQILRDNFSVKSYQRFNFEEEILSPFWRNENNGLDFNEFTKFILSPLYAPRLDSLFSIENFYARQKKFSEAVLDELVDITAGEDYSVLLKKERDKRNQEIIRSLFVYLNRHRSFTVKEYMEDLSQEDMCYQCEEHFLPVIILKLFELQNINIEAFRYSDTPIAPPQGEFSLAWCLASLPSELIMMRSIHVEKMDETFLFEVISEEKLCEFTMTNFKIEVIWDESKSSQDI